MSRFSDFTEAMSIMGLELIAKKHYSACISTEIGTCRIIASYQRRNIRVIAAGTRGAFLKNVSKIEDAIDAIESCYDNYMHSILIDESYVDEIYRSEIFAAINTRDIAKTLTRCKSSNVWAYGMDIKDRKDKTGDLYMQFKNKNGGAGDLYVYYSVPITMYRRLQSTPSVGRFVWKYLRNNFSYAKLTGNRRGVLPNAVNNIIDNT